MIKAATDFRQWNFNIFILASVKYEDLLLQFDSRINLLHFKSWQLKSNLWYRIDSQKGGTA